jgi:hypothetical protein
LDIISWELIFGSKTGLNERVLVATQSTFDPINTPGARENSALWLFEDLIILFGGFATDFAGNQGNF